MITRLRQRHPADQRGFTVVEALVSAVVLSIVMLIAIRAFQGGHELSRTATMQGDTQQSARSGMDLMTEDLRVAGYDLDLANGQRALVHAAPWDLVFNANVTPAPDSPAAPGFPRAMDATLAPATVPPGGNLYAPATTFASGAETIRYTLDSSGDGALDAADLDDEPEEASPNPLDFVLRKEIYGAMGDGTNGGVSEAVAVVRGPLPDGTGTLPMPLFTYWVDSDDDTSTPDVLHGDANGNGALDQAEIAAVGPLPAAMLPLVTRVEVTVTAEDAEPTDGGDYRTRELRSSVSFRNEAHREAVITGHVFLDTDGDGTYDPAAETPLSGVLVRLDTGKTDETDATGQYSFVVDPGSYAVTEFDPPGYVSTTANFVPVTVSAGSVTPVDFGDRSASGSGTIQGSVYHDQNMNGVLDTGEVGIENVVVTLHTGQSDTTDAQGAYSFLVPVASYTVVETDSTGWGSTTSNSVNIVLTADGDVQTADFGDIPAGLSGTLAGTVYLDENADAVFDPAETGIADVTVLVSGGAVTDSVVTNGSGHYSITVPPGLYTVAERDLPGYTSSTPNAALNVLVQVDSTTTVLFGDVLSAPIDFTLVAVATTSRALSIVSYDMSEDNKGDSDIVLGTQQGAGLSNLHVWHNQRRNSGTPITALFTSNPTFSRSTGAPIPVLLESDSDGDGHTDVVAGLETTTGQDLGIWVTGTSGSQKGLFAYTPDAEYTTNTGSFPLSLCTVRWPGQLREAIVVGTRDGSGVGHVEIWVRTGATTYAHLSSSDILYDARGALGAVTSLVTGDFDSDGYPDLAIAQDLGGNLGKISVFFGETNGLWEWNDTPKTRLLDTDGAALCLEAVDMKEDDGSDVDLLVGTSKGSYAGVIELWLNDGTGIFGLSGSGYRIPDDTVFPGAEVLAIDTARLDPDVFPDVIVGLRTNQYAGGLSVFQGTGYLPSTGSDWSSAGSGEVVTFTVDDFNLDGYHDVAVGTRTAATAGELAIYFGQ